MSGQKRFVRELLRYIIRNNSIEDERYARGVSLIFAVDGGVYAGSVEGVKSRMTEAVKYAYFLETSYAVMRKERNNFIYRGES